MTKIHDCEDGEIVTAIVKRRCDSATSTRRYVFASLLLVNVEKFDEDDGVYLLSSEQAGVSAYGETDSEALREFHVAFDLQYRALVEESEPGDLTPRAQQIRRWFQESVEIEKALRAKGFEQQPGGDA